MNSALATNAYRQSEVQSKIHPVKLIHLMYERTLTLLEMAEKGINDNNPQLRGESLGKSIAIITELYASIKEDDNSEAAGFLRGLYGSILTELPKVAVDNDIAIVKHAWKYINRLKEIWEKTAMVEAGLLTSAPKKQNTDVEMDIFHAHPAKKSEVAAGVSVSI